MENISSIELVIKLCAQNNYFNSNCCFVNVVRREQFIVAITSVCGESTHRIITYDSQKYHLFTINESDCFNLILSKSPLVLVLFNNVICVKDDYNLARKILFSINPIKEQFDKNAFPSLMQAWNNYKNEIVHTNSFSIRFNGIESDIQFYYETLIPCLSPIKDLLNKNNTQLQFYNHYGVKSAVYTIYFDDLSLKYAIIDSIQKFLFNNSPELLLNNIQIPYKRPFEEIEIGESSTFTFLVSLISEIQNSILVSHEKSEISQNYVITELYYAYILLGKFFFESKEVFFKANMQIFSNLIKETSSDNFRYILNSEIKHKAMLKIKHEYYLLCISNYDSLYNNYHDSLTHWLKLEQQVKHFELEENTKELLNIHILKLHDNDKVKLFHKVTDMLFKTFDIPSFYKSYIPFSIEFLKHEI